MWCPATPPPATVLLCSWGQARYGPVPKRGQFANPQVQSHPRSPSLLIGACLSWRREKEESKHAKRSELTFNQEHFPLEVNIGLKTKQERSKGRRGESRLLASATQGTPSLWGGYRTAHESSQGTLHHATASVYLLPATRLGRALGVFCCHLCSRDCQSSTGQAAAAGRALGRA